MILMSSERRFEVFNKLMQPKKPKKQFYVTILEVECLLGECEDGNTPEIVDGAEAILTTLVVQESDLPVIQKVLNQNKLTYTVQPIPEENENF